jgi:hypothetical protein
MDVGNVYLTGLEGAGENFNVVRVRIRKFFLLKFLPYRLAELYLAEIAEHLVHLGSKSTRQMFISISIDIRPSNASPEECKICS